MIEKEKIIVLERKHTMRLSVYEHNNLVFEPMNKPSSFRDRSYCSVPLSSKPSLKHGDEPEVVNHNVSELPPNPNCKKRPSSCCFWLKPRWPQVLAVSKSPVKEKKVHKYTRNSPVRRSKSNRSFRPKSNAEIDGIIFPQWTAFSEVRLLACDYSARDRKREL